MLALLESAKGSERRSHGEGRARYGTVQVHFAGNEVYDKVIVPLDCL